MISHPIIVFNVLSYEGCGARLRNCKRESSSRAASRKASTHFRWLSDRALDPSWWCLWYWWAKDENTFLVKYQDGDTDNTLQAKYQAKVDELAKMRRSASPDAAKVISWYWYFRRTKISKNEIFLNFRSQVEVLLQKPAFKPAAVSQPGYWSSVSWASF